MLSIQTLTENFGIITKHLNLSLTNCSFGRSIKKLTIKMKNYLKDFINEIYLFFFRFNL